MSISSKQALQELQEMFTDFDPETLKAVLVANNGYLEKSIEDLLKMAQDNAPKQKPQEEDEEDDNLFANLSPLKEEKNKDSKFDVDEKEDDLGQLGVYGDDDKKDKKEDPSSKPQNNQGEMSEADLEVIRKLQEEEDERIAMEMQNAYVKRAKKEEAQLRQQQQEQELVEQQIREQQRAQAAHNQRHAGHNQQHQQYQEYAQQEEYYDDEEGEYDEYEGDEDDQYHEPEQKKDEKPKKKKEGFGTKFMNLFRKKKKNKGDDKEPEKPPVKQSKNGNDARKKSKDYQEQHAAHPSHNQRPQPAKVDLTGEFEVWEFNYDGSLKNDLAYHAYDGGDIYANVQDGNRHEFVRQSEQQNNPPPQHHKNPYLQEHY